MIFFSFLIFTALGDQAFFHADGRSDRVKKWCIPKDKALPLCPPRGNTQETPAASTGGDFTRDSGGREDPRRTGSTTGSTKKDLKVFLSKSSMLCMKFSHYFTPCIFYLKLFFTLDSGRREGPRRTGSTTQERWPRSSGEETTYKRRSQTGSTLFNHPHLAIILCCYFTDSLFLLQTVYILLSAKSSFFKRDGRSDRAKKWRVPKDTAVPLSPPRRYTQETPFSQGKA